jgi:hypothetical protein
LLPFDDKEFRLVWQWFYADEAGEAETGNAGEHPVEE